VKLTFRPAIPADKPRILAITAQVWEGEDYVPDVIDEWLAPGTAELIAACAGDELVGFARYDRPFRDYAWFQGLRTDPAWQGRGVAKALMRHMLERARLEGIRRAGASTYVDNLVSQHIMEAQGFVRAAGFVYCEAGPEELAHEAASSIAITSIPPDEALAFIRRSRFLEAARGFFPHSWCFYPFALGPEAVLGRMRNLFGVRRGGELAALLCAGKPTHGPRAFSIDYLDGPVDAMALLARYALHLAGPDAYAEAMIPRWGDDAVPALAVLRDLGLNVWNDGREDVFVYESAV
jgi:GNAT superfamily N-acetyltransferase